ncbi:P1 family peptidase [Saccharothrix isguenensis]
MPRLQGRHRHGVAGRRRARGRCPGAGRPRPPGTAQCQRRAGRPPHRPGRSAAARTAGDFRAGARRGSIIIVVGTDAPLLPYRCDRIAHRAGFGVARTGGTGEPTSGDLVIAFRVAQRIEAGGLGADLPREQPGGMLSDGHIGPLFDAVVEAVEEAILNALLAGRTMVGRDGVVAHALPHERLVAVLSGSR